MATKIHGYGLTAECQRKQAAKFDAGLTNDALNWVADVLTYGEKNKVADELKCRLEAKVETPKQVWEILKNGVVLCNMINVIKPGIVKSINSSTMAFKEMENISKFLGACGELGMLNTDLFQTVDLFDQNNIPQVIATLIAVGRKSKSVEGYEGPTTGPQESKKNKREFTDEQLSAGKSVISLQMGSNKGASQAGLNFGKTRAIID